MNRRDEEILPDLSKLSIDGDNSDPTAENRLGSSPTLERKAPDNVLDETDPNPTEITANIDNLAIPVPEGISRPPLPNPMYPPPIPQPPQPEPSKFINAFQFLDQVKSEFSDQPKVYQQFLDIMKEFKAQKIEVLDVIRKVAELFRGRKHLISGFSVFLPPGYKIDLANYSDTLDPVPSPTPQNNQTLPLQPDPQQMQAQQQQMQAAAVQQPPQHQPQMPNPVPQQQVNFNQAINYVSKIKTRFQDQPHIYRKFLDIIHNYKKGQERLSKDHTIELVYDQISELFKDHPDLIEEFIEFLPKNQNC